MRILETVTATLGLSRGGGRAAGATLAIFAAGAALAFSWALPLILWPAVTAIITVLTAAAAALMMGTSVRLRAPATLLLVAVHLFWLALAVAFGALLGWSVPGWMWTAAALASAAVVYTAARRTAVRVPVALPLGIVVAALISGWMREDGLLRCDDYLRATASGATVLLPSTPELARCAPGEALVVGRYPRQFWEDPRGDRFIVTTQRGDHQYTPAIRPGARVADWFTGAVCTVEIGSSTPPRCFGEGKAEAVAESITRDRLYVASHDAHETIVHVLERGGDLQPIERTRLPIKGALLYFDDAKDVLALAEDDAREVYRLRVSDLSPRDPVPVTFVSDQLRYDQARHEGIACGSGADGAGKYMALAYTGEPWTTRVLAPTSRYPSTWLAATWGCDWDPVGRRAYVAAASLGAIVEIDYDTGDVLRRFYVGVGARPLVYDAERGMVFAGFFLNGDVIALDLASGKVVRRWSAGRFIRSVALSRDRESLLVASNLGVVRIPLTGLPRSAAAPSKNTSQ